MLSMRFIFVSCLVHFVNCRNDDNFNYRETSDRDFGPEDWNEVTCDDVTKCAGWPDDWLLGIEWRLERNSCRYCPAGSSRCGSHHQSPVDLTRRTAVAGDAEENKCIDVHWMKYEDSSCTWERLTKQDAFSIERHALKITQPLEDDGQTLKCPSDVGRRFGRIDFSKGFSDWWFLSHTDFKVPSEHTQEGKRYSAEVQMAHFYSVSGEVAGVDNQMATLSIFLEAYDDSPPYPHLDRLICEWRRVEDATRESCGMPSVTPYPGCFNPNRGTAPFPTGATEVPMPSPVTPQPPLVGVPTAAGVADTSSSDAPIIGAPVVGAPVVGAPVVGAPVAGSTSPPTNPPTLDPTPGTTPGATPEPTPQQTDLVAPDPTPEPTPQPTNPPAPDPTPEPTPRPTNPPAPDPTPEPTPRPTNPPAPDPTPEPTPRPTNPPAPDPTPEPTPRPTNPPAPDPTPKPTPRPTNPPVPNPTPEPTPRPTNPPVPDPTPEPTPRPTNPAAPDPTPEPTPRPTNPAVPDFSPTDQIAVTARSENIAPTIPPVDETTVRRNLRRSVYDILTANTETGKESKISLASENFRPPDKTDEEWTEWIEALSARDRGEASESQRKLLEMDPTPFHNYQFLIDVKTEYYYRYSGTQTVPPCYGPLTSGTRGNTNHWRVMKDPIRVHPRQIAEMERLLKDRTAPTDDNARACTNDTAGKIDADGHISVARPLMQRHNAHFMTFCECQDWGSKWPEDRAWCNLKNGDQKYHLFDHPYNFGGEAPF